MRAFLRSLFARKAQPARSAARAPRLGVERLDDRLLLSASPILMPVGTTPIVGTGVTASISGSTLSILDGGSGETVRISNAGTQVQVQVTEANGSVHSVSSMPLIPLHLTQVQFQARGQQDSFSNLTALPSSFGDTITSASYSPGTHALSVSRLAGSASDDVSVSTLSGRQWLYEAQSGSWYQPGGAVTSLVHGGSSVSVQGGDSTYLLHQGSAGDSVATLAVAPQDAGLRKVFVQDATRDYITHGGLTRTDLLDLFTQAGKDGTVSAQELSDLQTLVAATGVSMPADVRDLAGKVVTTGGLQAGSSASQLQALVNTWFYGTDTPALPQDDISTIKYVTVSGALYTNGGPSITDVTQGAPGDCYLLASLGAVAQGQPQAIKDMIHDNGDGTYSVRFYQIDSANQAVVADYVTVNSQLPVNQYGYGSWQFFGGNRGQELSMGQTGTTATTTGPLWVALAEKAYAQEHNTSYAGLAYQSGAMYPQNVPIEITGSTLSYTANGTNFSAFLQSQLSGGGCVIAYSLDTGLDGVENDHVYAIQSYDPATQTFAVYNPWGPSGTLHLSAAQVYNDFGVFSLAMPGSALARQDADPNNGQGIFAYNVFTGWDSMV